MTDYSQGKIYAIKSSQTEKIYIGSTTKTLNDRFLGHKCGYNKWVEDNNNSYTTSYEIIKYEDAYIELLEKYPCDDKMELNKKEGEYIRNMECINKRIEGRTKKEYMKEYGKEYREQNKEQIKEYGKEYREEHKEQTKEYDKQYYEEHKEQRKEYREQNKENIKEKGKEYYQKNKEQRQQKIKCVCGKEFRRDNKRRHEKTMTHINYIEEMKEKGDLNNITEFFEQFKLSYKSQ